MTATTRSLEDELGSPAFLADPYPVLEAAIALQALRQRWPRLRLEPGCEPAWKANSAFRGRKSLPVRFG